MRIGEAENCIDNHNIDRCLVPVRDGGVHTYQRGSRNALAIYNEILSEDPEDYTARWLLNVAHMTLGTYPDSVAAPFRIPESCL